MTASAKIMYAVLMEKQQKSAEMGWIDEKDHAYILANIVAIGTELNWDEAEVLAAVEELERFGLVVHLFFCSCKFHCFTDGNKRIAITLTADFLLRNGYMGIANVYFREMENISYHVAAGHIDEELLTELMTAILDNTYDNDEALKLKLFNAISVEEQFYE